jgi:hypothetical protein
LIFKLNASIVFFHAMGNCRNLFCPVLGSLVISLICSLKGIHDDGNKQTLCTAKKRCKLRANGYLAGVSWRPGRSQKEGQEDKEIINPQGVPLTMFHFPDPPDLPSGSSRASLELHQTSLRKNIPRRLNIVRSELKPNQAVSKRPPLIARTKARWGLVRS